MRELGHITLLIDRMADAPDFEAAAQALIEWARELTGCESAFVRMRREGGQGRGWMPVVAASGASSDFLRDEAVVTDSECMCGRVSVGTIDADRPYFTDEGSFLWGRVGSIFSEFEPATLGSMRSRCVLEGYESLAIIPLVGADGTVGCIHLADSRPDLFAETRELLEAAGRMAGRLLHNHREQDSERAALETIREALLPTRPPSVADVELGVFATTAEVLMRVGGDFYDAFELPDGKVALVAGDYSGKGLDAVGAAANLRYHLAALVASAEKPGAFLQQANVTLSDVLSPRRFATAICCALDPRNGRLEVALAGHPAPLLRRKGRVIELDAPANLPLGVAVDGLFETASFSLRKDDLLVLYTDGVSEARHEGSLFGIEGIARIIMDDPDSPLAETARAVVTASGAHHDPALPDDDRLVLLARTLR
ncbi:MAG TPA: GAF domain-containing SpoIIE family protein phosphatase [Thermoleophilia bacterium]|nr:GAF domain-containing SpoIIE family protein phosphatase [Thermoleophilia bacterium]